jgi:hypothetical protein
LEDDGKATVAGIAKGRIVKVHPTEEGGEKLAYYVSD